MNGRLITVQVVLTLLHCLAIASAFFRLHRRKKTGQVDWDDYAAAFALVLNLIYFPTLWFPVVDLSVFDTARYHKKVLLVIIDSWLLHIVWALLLWTTRISLGLSITRILPKKTRFSYASWALVLILVAGTIVVMVISAILCGISYQTWSIVPPFQCYVGSSYYILFTCLDVISDLLLVVVPLWIFWRDKKLTPMSRLVIKFGFAANGVTAVASLITGVILLVTFTDMSTRISTHILCIISLLACNSLVVLTSIYRCFRTEKIDQAPRRPPTPCPRHPTATPLQNLNSTTHFATLAGRSSAYTEDYSEQAISSESLRLTMTVVRTDPSFPFPSDMNSRTTLSHSSRNPF